MRHLLLFLPLLFITQNYAQNYQLGKVTIEELKEKNCPIDTSAVAAYLFKDEFITYESDGSFVSETRVKLKIYKKEGYRYANISEVFYKLSKEPDFKDVAIYNLVNGEVKKSKLGREGEFKEEVNKEVSIKKITLPDVKEGSIIEYRILDYTRSAFNLVNFYFQEAIPIRNIKLTVEYPTRLSYNKSMSGRNLDPVVKKERVNDTYNVRYLKNKDVYELVDAPALKDEGFVNNINNYRFKVRYELAAVMTSKGYPERITTDWETIAKKIYESDGFGAELLKKDYFEKELEVALTDKNTREERINAVLAFVKNNVKWNEGHGIFCDKGVKEAFKSKNGNVADINLMLTAMLRHIGLEANPILITTRSQVLNPNPSLTSHNYVICGVEIENDVILLDATSKYSLPDILPLRDLNWFGRIIRSNGSTAGFDIMPKNNSQEIINIIGSINTEGEVTGKVRDKYIDYNAFLYREAYNKITKEDYVASLEKRHEGLELSDFEVKNSEDLSQPVIEEYSFVTTNEVEVIGNKMYFSPMLFFAKKENPFKQEKREYPIDFVYPKQDKFNISITIPEGYAIETLPESKAVAMPDNLASFKYNISMNENKIQLQCIFDINQAMIGSEYYEVLKNLYKEIVNKHTEKVVLKKV
ncbi:DUF3857 domain-containing protein [Flavobacterium terrisoli]|uniref:DUF3857 domain-containing protein n=1 Tax=Flavobacterium terrisoli TaxID=3242195 RepID=UPI0025432B1C|nr:DUF3857 domain-containing protein [Flavobacterium buctense]